MVFGVLPIALGVDFPLHNPLSIELPIKSIARRVCCLTLRATIVGSSDVRFASRLERWCIAR